MTAREPSAVEVVAAAQEGHEFNAKNTSINVDGHRVCKACARERATRYRRRREVQP